jgi:hypothetical protein
MTNTAKKSPSGEGVPDDGLFWESKVAKQLGLSRERVRELRAEHLTAEDWITKGNAVVYTQRGLEKITAAAGAGAEAPAEEPVKAGPPEVARLVVRKVCGNKRVMLALRVVADRPLCERGSEPTLVVRVKDNACFMAGMEFDAVAVGDGSFQFTGRLPRRKGRW